jgi:hypothetical protein
MKMDLKKCATLALKQCLALGKQEQLLIVCDEPCIEVGRAFFESGIKLCRETVMMQIVPRKQNGNEPPEHIADVLGRFDVAVIPTSKSLSQCLRKGNPHCNAYWNNDGSVLKDNEH